MSKIFQLPYATKKDAMFKAIQDCRDPGKTCVGAVHFAGISKEPEQAFSANKYMTETELRKYLSKTVIIRMDTPWPKELADRITYAIRLQRLLDYGIEFWAFYRFQVVGAVHSDSVYPYLWLVIDTSQVGFGCQLFLNPTDTENFTYHLGHKMTELKLGETLPCTQTIPTISEAKLRTMMQKDSSNTKISLPICAEALAPRIKEDSLRLFGLSWYQEIYSPTTDSHREMRRCD